MPGKAKPRTSKTCYVPSGVSSFFEICDQNPDGTRIQDPLSIGARGGGFIIKKGTVTKANTIPGLKKDEVRISGRIAGEAKTSLLVIQLIRREFGIPPVQVLHRITPPIGQGFGTSGAGALSTSISIGDLFDLKFTLSKASAFAHTAEVQNLTGLGTVISLASGGGAIGLVTEPGSYSIGRTETILSDYDDYYLACATFGPIKKSPILSEESSREKINKFGRITLEEILNDPTPGNLLKQARVFSEKTGLASKELLRLSDRAVDSGALGATPNMIGNAIHCLVEKRRRGKFSKRFSEFIPREAMFESDLIQSGPRFL
jgi:pantoate kinase